MIRRSLALSVVGLGLVLSLVLPSLSFAETGQWSRPVLISGFQPGSEFPSLAVDGSENVHVVWSSVQGPQNILLFYTRWDGEAWSRSVDIRFGSDRSALAVDRYGDLNLLYLPGARATYVRAHTDSATSSKGWSNEQALTAFGTTSAIQMAIDDGGVIHVLRTQTSTECGTCADVVYQQSTDGGSNWSDPVNLSVQPADRRRVQLKIDSRGTLHAVWDGLGARGVNQSVRYTYSKDHGKSWAPPQQFFGSKGAPIQAALGIGGNDQVVLVWQTLDHTDAYFQVSNDGGNTWGQPGLIPGLMAGKPFTGYDRYDMATDSAGIVHLAAVGRGGNPDLPWLYHLQWDGKTWTKPEVVYDGPDFPEYPSQAVSNGNRLHLTWFTRGASNVSGPADESYKIWYSSMQTSAPVLAPAPTFTLAPLISPTHVAATPSTTPTPRSFPASNPGSSADTGPVQQQISVLAGIIPALLIIGIVLVLRLRPRRHF